MSKILKITPEVAESLKQEFMNAIMSAKLMDGKFTFTRALEQGKERAVIRFRVEAYAKMMELVHSFSNEVAWHLVCRRGEQENEYIVDDIIVYPQETTSTTVETNVKAYNEWQAEGIRNNDERFFHLFGQGHSHVNMSTGASGTDMDHQRKVVNDMFPNGFYIFVIWNKKNEHNCWVYDGKTNLVFENKDIDVCIGDYDLSGFIADAKAIVKPKTYQTPVQTSGFGTGGYTHLKDPYMQANVTPATKVAAAASVQKESAKTKVRANDGIPVSMLYDDDDNDPTSPFYVTDHYYGWGV